jgi:hypothetical protein
MNPENIIKSKVRFSQEKINPAFYGEQSQPLAGLDLTSYEDVS